MFSYITELNTKVNELSKTAKGDTAYKEKLTDLIKDNNAPITLTNAIVDRIEIVKSNQNNGFYSEEDKSKKIPKYILWVYPYKKTEDGKLVLIYNSMHSLGIRNSFVKCQPEHLISKDLELAIKINVYDELNDSIYSTVRLDKDFGPRFSLNGDAMYYTTDISMKVTLKDIKPGTDWKDNSPGNEYEFDLVEITNITPVKSDLRTKFESIYKLDRKKYLEDFKKRFKPESFDFHYDLKIFDRKYDQGSEKIIGINNYITQEKPYTDTIEIQNYKFGNLSYIGDVMYRTPNGKGKLIDPTEVYFLELEGTFSGDTSCVGTKKYSNGETCVGSFKYFLENGHCDCTYPDGSKYSGNFVLGQKVGVGEFTTPSGEIQQQEHNDVPVSPFGAKQEIKKI